MSGISKPSISRVPSKHGAVERMKSVDFTVRAKDVTLQKVLQHHHLAGASVHEVSFGGGRHLLEFAQQACAYLSNVDQLGLALPCSNRLMLLVLVPPVLG